MSYEAGAPHSGDARKANGSRSRQLGAKNTQWAIGGC